MLILLISEKDRGKEKVDRAGDGLCLGLCSRHIVFRG